MAYINKLCLLYLKHVHLLQSRAHVPYNRSMNQKINSMHKADPDKALLLPFVRDNKTEKWSQGKLCPLRQAILSSVYLTPRWVHSLCSFWCICHHFSREMLSGRGIGSTSNICLIANRIGCVVRVLALPSGGSRFEPGHDKPLGK